MNYSLLMSDPMLAHREMMSSGGYRSLLGFAQRVAEKYKINLAIFPHWESDVTKWKMIAKILSGNVAETLEPGTFNHKDVQGLFEMCSHFRSASLCERGGKKYYRGGCLVRKDKLDRSELSGFVKLVKEYNSDIKKKGHFTSMRKWMEEHYGVTLT